MDMNQRHRNLVLVPKALHIFGHLQPSKGRLRGDNTPDLILDNHSLNYLSWKGQMQDKNLVKSILAD